MKLIPKKQQGGYLNAFADYPIVQSPQSAPQQGQTKASSKKETSEEKGKISEKDLFSLMKDIDGLPNEMQQLVYKAQMMYQDASLFGGDLDIQGLSSQYSQLIYEIKHANFNKKEYDKAYTEVEKNQGLNELAVSASGKVITYDKDKGLQQVPVSEYLSNQENYNPITNSNLLWLRAHHPEYINDNDLLNTVSNGIGMEKIQYMINERFSKLGSITSTSEGNISISDRKILSGMQLLQQLSEDEQANLGLDGMYKAKIITKDQRQQAEQALKYIYSTLPRNAQAILALHSQNAENPTLGATQIIWSLISSQMDQTRDVSITYDSSVNVDDSKRKDGSKGKGGLGDEDINTAQQFIRGYGQKEDLVIAPGTNVATAVTSTVFPLVKANGDPLGAHATLQEVTQGQYGPILNWSGATMGGRKINSTYYNQILVEDGYIHSIDFPVDANGNPDLRPTTLKAKREADQKIAALGINLDDPISVQQHAQEINQILEEVGLRAAYDSQGNIVSGNWARFGVINAIADNRALGIDPFDEQNQLLQEVTDENTINNLIQTIQEKNNIEKLDFDKNDSLIEGDYDMLMKGTIWIPLYVNDFNAGAGSGTKISRDNAYEAEQRQHERDNRDQLIHRYRPAEQL